MRNTKAFELCYILNFFLCIVFLFEPSFNHNRRPGIHRTEYQFYFVAIEILFGLVFSFFDFACFRLLKTYKAGLTLSKKSKIIGTISAIAFASLNLLLLIGCYYFILMYLQKSEIHTIKLFINHFIYWGLTITSVYLNIAYWIIRNQIKSQLANTISTIGEEQG